ncbi:UPF0688 protein C1orf174 homolog isoform X1 [Kryptolebias marmoratus]|uniref:UPF0688 protein C1orf174 homolog isoform X1 n=1 Tax=Kryptolebias marmoratus TaxID=37003 RepID=UPI0007F8EC81|nr:UPF0688 protein C1orf174 homolog isoform X1 [Kryptolebias marmoratus]
MRKMPGQLGNLKSRKRKRSSEVRTTRKTPASGRSSRSKADGSSAARPGKTADPAARLSRICCECHESAGGRRCSASPELEGQEGKENELRTEEADNTWDKHEAEHMACEENCKNFFPDDDSNQILPVEQFFGNMDIVQDFPQRLSAAPSSAQRKDRKRHYYAREDSDEEEVGLGVMQRDEVNT